MPGCDVYGHDEAVEAVTEGARWFVEHLGELERHGVRRCGLWGIWDRLESVCVDEGCDYDRLEWYDPDGCGTMGASDVVENAHDENPSRLDNAVRDLFDGWPGPTEPDEIGDAYAYLMAMDAEPGRFDGQSDRDRAIERVAELIGEWSDYRMQRMHDVWGVRPDGLFLTEEDAKAHLAANWYHYATGAKPVCLTTWRSPRFAHLMESLCMLGGALYDPGYGQQVLPGMEDLDGR